VAIPSSSKVPSSASRQEKKTVDALAHLNAIQNSVMLMIQGHTKSQLVCIFAKLAIADSLSSGPKKSAEMAALANLPPQLLARMFSGFVVCGLVRQLGDGTFELTNLGAVLKSGAPGCLKEVAIRVHDLDYAAWGALLKGLQEGVTPFQLVHGSSFYEVLADSNWHDSFNDEMAATSRSVSKALAAACDFAGGSTVVDVGGGKGVLLGEILGQHTSSAGVLFDLPSVVTNGHSYVRSLGVADRCSIVGGDFFQHIPSGGDVYILNRILHNWNDDQCLTILANCREASDDKKRLVIIERVMPERVTGPSVVVASDLMMFVLVGGRERTIADFESLLSRSGFDLSHATIAADSFAVIEAIAR
jgi:hypothetical protein